MKKNLLRISQIGSNYTLPKTNKTVSHNFEQLNGIDFYNENVMLEGFGDIHPFRDYPRFIKAKTVFMEHDYKYFHYYWLDRKTFPIAEKFYVNGHPCDYPVLERGLELHFVDTYYHTANRYSPENPNIHFISSEDYYKLLEEYEEVDPSFLYRNNNVKHNENFEKSVIDNYNHSMNCSSNIYKMKE